MGTPGIQDLKKELTRAGFEIFHTRSSEIHLAERPRENQILDAGVAVTVNPWRVRLIVRAQRSDFPNDSDEALLSKARDLAKSAVEHGYAEVGVLCRPLFDPGDSQRVIDLWAEVTLEKPIESSAEMIAEARFAMHFDKVVSR